MLSMQLTSKKLGIPRSLAIGNTLVIVAIVTAILFQIEDAPMSSEFQEKSGVGCADEFFGVENPHTIASGLRVPKAFADFMILDAVRESGGRAMAAAEDRLKEWTHLAMSLEGIALCPESATCIGVLETCIKAGHVKPDEQIVLFNTGATQKYVEFMEVSLPSVDKAAVDWDALVTR